jgi:enediyne biosynthesis protein E4
MSYQSAQDPRLHFGLGRQAQVDSIEVRWPTGTMTKLSNIKSNQIITIEEGKGVVKRGFPLVPRTLSIHE